MTNAADRFSRLSRDAQRDLARPGFGADWFADADEPLAATVLNLYAALSAQGLWPLVTREWQSDVGVLQFTCDDVDALHRALAERDFTPVRTRRWGWESRERRPRASLHLKHFDGWDPDKVQAHVDPIGTVPRWYWWCLPPLPLALILLHCWHWHAYTRPTAVRRALLRSGVGAGVLGDSVA